MGGWINGRIKGWIGGPYDEWVNQKVNGWVKKINDVGFYAHKLLDYLIQCYESPPYEDIGFFATHNRK